MIETFRITSTNPYLDREEEWPGLSLEEAASRMDDLTGVGADVILADFEEDCVACGGKGRIKINDVIDEHGPIDYTIGCTACLGSGKRRDPWEWVDSESGREVTMRREVG